MPFMVDLFPKDKPRQFLMAVFLVLAIIEFTRASLIWAVRYYLCSKFFTKSENVDSKAVVSNLAKVN